MADPANILIVDDNERNRNLLNKIILALKYNPSLADNGVTALSQLEKQSMDLVLLDILMPKMDGYEVLERIKSSRDLRHIPVIMISAVDELESVVRCIEEGADDYLIKPFNSTLLKARINACLEKKRLRDREKQLYTELKDNHKALQAAEQARDAMVHMVVHDLRNPLQSVLGFAELLSITVGDEPIDRKELAQNLQTICNSANEMSSLIKSILDASKMEAGEMPVSLTSINALELVEGICKQFDLQAESKGVLLSFEAESDNIMARADGELLSRVLQNLLTNALKYSAGSKIVSISVKRDGNNALFCVANDGPRIPDRYREKIFEKYFQVEIGDKRKMYGVGLGLTFCKMAVEAQGGKIWVENEGEKGTCFKVALKMVQE